MSQIPKRKLSFDALRTPGFSFLLFTRLFSLAALQAQAVIIEWQIYAMTGSKLLLGLAGLAEAIPALSCALFAGHIVDQSRPQKVCQACLGLLVLNTLGLFLIGGEIIKVDHHIFLWLAYIAIFISGFTRSFIMPASFSLLAQIVPKKDITSASAWLSTGFQTAAIVSPALAGIIYGHYGHRIAWSMPLTLMVLGFLMISFVRPTLSTTPRPAREPAIQSITAGLKFIYQTPVLFASMSLDMLAVLFGGAVALLPPVAKEILKLGPEGMGILRAAPAIGALVTAIVLAVLPMKRIRATTLLWVVTGFGLCMIGFGLSRTFWLSLTFLTISGSLDSVSVVIRSTLMQLLTPDHMRGRVSSVNSMFIISSNELGAFESGALAQLVGVSMAITLGGIGTLLVAAITAKKFPSFRRTVITQEDGDAKITS
jgi:MFS family permease